MTTDMWQEREKTDEESTNWLAPEDEKKLQEWLQTNWKDKPMKRLAILTQLMGALRFCELRALLFKDIVEVPTPGLWIRRSIAGTEVSTPKNKTARLAGLPMALINELKDLACNAPDEPLFNPPRSKYLAKTSFNRWLRKACQEAGVPRITSHGLRHTAGASYAALGYGQKAIASFLGHRDTKSTERYVHAAKSLMTEAVNERWENVVQLDANNELEKK